MTASIIFFPVNNGDMTLATFDNDQQLLIDLHVRKAADDPDDDTPDVMAQLREHLKRDEKNRPYVDGFLLSHPDKDHIGGLVNRAIASNVRSASSVVVSPPPGRKLSGAVIIPSIALPVER